MKSSIKFKSIFLLLQLVVVAACSNLKDTTEPPAELTNIEQKYQFEVLWQKKLTVKNPKSFQLQPAFYADTLYTASRNGVVRAVDKNNGAHKWKSNLKVELSSSFGISDSNLYIADTKGNLIALDRKNGEQVWSYALGAAVVAPATAANSTVVVKTIDGQVSAFSETTGDLLWRIKQTSPSLILRTASAPTIANNFVFVGMDNGRLLALSLLEGKMFWETPIAMVQGTTELEQMRDIVAKPIVDMGMIYAASYQGNVAAINFGTAKPLFVTEVSSYQNMLLASDMLFISDENSQVHSLDKNTGQQNWLQDALRARSLTAPATDEMGNILVADFDGYMHVLDAYTGAIIGRKRLSKKAYEMPISFDNGVFYALDSNGKMVAFKLKALKRG